MTQLSLVKATLDDLDLITNADQDVNHTPWSYNKYLTSYNNPHHTIMLLIENAVIKGVIVYSLFECEVEILQLFILKSYQKFGYATRLLQIFINNICIQLHRISRILLEVRSDNIPAINLYNKFGFTVVYTRKNYYKCGNKSIDACVMLKTLYGS